MARASRRHRPSRRAARRFFARRSQDPESFDCHGHILARGHGHDASGSGAHRSRHPVDRTSPGLVLENIARWIAIVTGAEAGADVVRWSAPRRRRRLVALSLVARGIRPPAAALYFDAPPE